MSPSAHRPGRAPLRKRSSPALRRDRARRLVPDRRARGAGPRRHALRQRRLPTRPRGSCPALTAPAARPFVHGPPRPSRPAARKGLPAGRDFDVIHFHIGLPALSDFAPPRDSLPDDPSRTAGPSGPGRRVPRVLTTLRSCRSRERSGSPCPKRAWVSTVPPRASAPTSTPPGRGRAATSRFSDAFRPRSAWTGRSRSLAGPAGALRIAAKVDRADSEYFESSIRPLLSAPHVEFVGEISRQREDRLSGGRRRAAVPDRLARALRAGPDRGPGVRRRR